MVIIYIVGRYFENYQINAFWPNPDPVESLEVPVLFEYAAIVSREKLLSWRADPLKYKEEICPGTMIQL
jgi:hypothetical protein